MRSIILFISLLALVLVILIGCAATSPNVQLPPQEPPAYYLKHVHPDVIVVLGSGSARGFAHAGVLKALEKNHIPIDMIVGTSAGSIVGSLYADNPSANSLQHVLLNTPRNEVIDFSLMDITDGPISGNGLQNFLVHNIKAKSFADLKIPFIAVATDLDTGQLHTFNSGPIPPAVNASSAAPPFFRPVKMYGKTYVDGGLIDPVAVDVAKRFHPKVIIAVSLNYSLSKDKPTNGPGVFLRGFDMMLMRLNDYSAAKADIIIRPKPTDEVSMFEGEKRSYMMRLGEEATEKAMPAIKKLLAKNHIDLKNKHSTYVKL